MSRLFDICISMELKNKPDIKTILDELKKEIELDHCIHNSEHTNDLDYWYEM